MSAPAASLSEFARGLLLLTEAGPGSTFAATPYDDGGHSLVIGWGHRLFHGESFTQPIDRYTAERLFLEDLRNADWAVNQMGMAWTQCQFDALALFAFCHGPVSLGASMILRRLRECPDDPAAVTEVWLRAGKRGRETCAVMDARRHLELLIFQDGQEDAILRAANAVRAARQRSFS